MIDAPTEEQIKDELIASISSANASRNEPPGGNELTSREYAEASGCSIGHANLKLSEAAKSGKLIDGYRVSKRTYNKANLYKFTRPS